MLTAAPTRGGKCYLPLLRIAAAGATHGAPTGWSVSRASSARAVSALKAAGAGYTPLHHPLRKDPPA